MFLSSVNLIVERRDLNELKYWTPASGISR